MWGDPERAFRLDGSDALVSFLFQVTGPAHIPWQDPVWQELLHGYNVWVHCSVANGNNTTHDSAASHHGISGFGEGNDFSSSSGMRLAVLERACATTVQYAPRTSNLAALALHVTRQLRDFSATQQHIAVAAASTTTTSAAAATETNLNGHGSSSSRSSSHRQQQQQLPEQDQVAAFSNRISLVGKARALSGALNLLRILAHAVIAAASSSSSRGDPSNFSSPSSTTYSGSNRHRRRSSQSTQKYAPTDQLKEAFLYKCREDGTAKDVGADLLDAVLQFLCSAQLLDDIPELYDCVTLALQLVTVLLSTQLYQTMQSSFQKAAQAAAETTDNDCSNYSFWNILMEQANNGERRTWSPRSLLAALLEWQLHRPAAPSRSIQYHSCVLAQQVVTAKGEKVGGDGMYESHLVVQARAPDTTKHNGNSLDRSESHSAITSSPSRGSGVARTLSSNHSLLDATRGVLVLSGKIILLPFRLMSLALGLWGLHQLQDGSSKYDQAYKQHLRKYGGRRSRTRDVLWLTMSPVADLSSGLLLLLSNNERAEQRNGRKNVFRIELEGLSDNRWEADANDLPDLPDILLGSRNGDSFNHSFHSEEGSALLLSPAPSSHKGFSRRDSTSSLTVNFEGLFASFGSTVHTEPGALLLYTMLQSSPTFASSIAVRSDLDTLVLPLLRTLYFATSLRFHVASQQDFHHGNSSNHHHNDMSGRGGGHSSSRRSRADSYASGGSSSVRSIRDCPFRSQSQLYVTIILLLLFSQDASFGADAFRRVMVPSVPWYKERYLKEISLGSVLILALLRSLAFNLNRQHDAFLLSNCCAVLMNLSSSIVDLHDYAAMRLASLTVSSIKRYLVLRKENPDNDEDDLTTPTSMHGEAARTLLCVLKHCLGQKNIDKNLHLVYALVYHQADFKRLFATKGCPFKKSEIGRVQTVTSTAVSIIERDGSARTAPKALKILSDSIEQIRDAVADGRKRAEPEDFTFTYEEEADPEIFFAPYVWEVIVCVLTSASLEWYKNRIQVFPLLDEQPDEEDFESDAPEISGMIPQFARDVSDVV